MFDCEYITNKAFDVCHDSITSEVHVIVPFRNLLQPNTMLLKDVKANTHTQLINISFYCYCVNGDGLCTIGSQMKAIFITIVY